MTFGQLLTAFMHQHQIKPADLARAMGVTRQRVNYLKRCKDIKVSKAIELQEGLTKCFKNNRAFAQILLERGEIKIRMAFSISPIDKSEKQKLLQSPE